MNLNELRLKALLSLKRPLPTSEKISEQSGIAGNTETNETTLTPAPALHDTFPDKEEGEISDYSTSGSESSDNQNQSKKGGFRNNSQRHPPNKKTKYTWTRPFYKEDPTYTGKSLDTLLALKSSILGQLDEAQALLAASEDHEQELLVEIEECRNLQRKCSREHAKLEKKLDKLMRTIQARQSTEDELNRQVSSTNYKKLFVGKMLKESYCRSLGSRFLHSKLYKMYCDTVGIDAASSFSFNHAKIDPQTPFCATELVSGKCPYRKEACTMQHIESLKCDTTI